MVFEELIAALGQRLGVELRVDEAGACRLVVDAMTLSIQELPEIDSVVLLGEIGEPPPQGLERLLSTMLEANHMFAGTRGATISRDPASGRFHLCRLLDARCLDGEALADALEIFITTLASWCALVKDYREAPQEAAPDETAEPPAFGTGDFLVV